MFTSLLKRVRTSQPFNRLTTSALKQLFTLTHLQSEFVIKHLPRVGPTSINLPESKSLLIDSTGKDWIPTQLFWRGWQGYEPEVTPLFYQLAKRSAVIFDVGAHIGFFTLLAASTNPQSEVYSFEPLQRVYERLEHNVALNGFGKVHCVQAALGQEEGQAQFYFPNEHAPVASSLRSDRLLETLGEKVVQHVTVPVFTVDGFVAQHGITRLDLIKLDTERTEDQVLAGARETLAQFRPDIICEVWPDANNVAQLESLLRPIGYLFYHLLPAGPERKEKIEPAAEALNYLFTTNALPRI
jgi:FkbM family methyltransferase